MKRLLTPTFVLFAGGLALAGIAVTMLIFDTTTWAITARGIAAAPLVRLGWNALVVYLGERVFLVVTDQTTIGDIPLTGWIFNHSPVGGDTAALTHHCAPGHDPGP